MIWISSIEALDPPHETWLPLDVEVQPTPVRARRSTAQTARIVLRACRPRQWSKNVLLLAAPAAAGVIAVASERTLTKD